MARSTIAIRVSASAAAFLTLLFATTGSAHAAWETLTDRPGSDYRSFPIAKEVEAFVAVKQCEDACKNEAQCKAFTYAKPGVRGDDARCFLKNSVPAKVSSSCCTSGVVRPQTKADYCNNYSLDAQLDAKNNVNYQCSYAGNRWVDNYSMHYNWCMQVAETASKQEAAARKNQLAQCQKPSTTGDLAADDVCYSVVGSEVFFYPIVKNVGGAHWRSNEKGEYVIGSTVGSISTEVRRELPAYPYWELGSGKSGRLDARKEPYHPENHYRFGWRLRHKEDTNAGNNELFKRSFDTFSGGLTGSRLAFHPWLLANKACTKVPIKYQPLNLYWSGTDLNGIPLNPSWGWQLEHSYSNADYYPDIAWLTPLLQVRNFKFLGYSVKKIGEERDFSKAMDQPTFKEYGGNYIPGPVDIPVDGVCGPHVNWTTPVTYEGRLKWAGYDSDDGDLNFYLFTDQGYGAVKKGSNHGGIKVEFDSNETADHFKTPWWSKRFSLAKPGWDFAEVDNKAAIVTGMWGFDCAHECASELHPAWTMAIRIKEDDPNDDVWVMFVRNWGNEGFCSDNVFPVMYPKQGGQHVYRFLLPWRPGAASVAVSPKTQFLQKGGVGMQVQPMPNKGVVVAFSLPAPDKRPRINGELHLKWTYAQGVSPKPYPVSKTAVANATAATGVTVLEDTAMNQRIMQELPPEEETLYREVLRTANLKDPQVVADLDQPTSLVKGAMELTAREIPQIEVRPDTRKMERKRAAVQQLQIDPGLYLQMQPVMEDVLEEATYLQPEVGSVGATGKSECERYARRAVAQQRENVERGCGFQGPQWNAEHQDHLNWCRHGENVRYTAGETRAREEALARCRGGSGGGAAEDECERYAQRAVAQQRENVERGCGFRGPEWNPAYQDHLNWCRHGENVRYTEGATRAREEALAGCREGSGVAARQGECRRYAERAVAQHRENVERGCGFQGPQWNAEHQDHLNWCLHGENVSYTEGETRAREDALARCRGGAGRGT